MKNKPLLSICIPTCNRAQILKKVLSSITENYSFDDNVEIVISDNASTDETEIICKEFTQKYENVVYFKNEKNCDDNNFWLALTRATGRYRKLQNDYLGFVDNALEFMKNVLSENLEKNIFFTGNSLFTKEYKSCTHIECENINDYILAVSSFTTYISLFGAWEEDLLFIKEPLKNTALKLNQVDWTYQLLTHPTSKKTILINNPIYKSFSNTLSTRGGYNWFEIHVKHYYDIMQGYVDKGFITKKTLQKDKNNCLYHFKKEFSYVYLSAPTYWKYDTANSTKILFKYFRKTIRLYVYYIALPIIYIKRKLATILKKIRQR